MTDTVTLTKLPTRQELRLINRMAFVMPPMALSFGIRGDRSLIHVINEYRRDPSQFDTYLDPVAVDRAMRGDRKVWENLTHYERRHVLQRADEVPEWIREQVWQVGHQQISRAKRDMPKAETVSETQWHAKNGRCKAGHARYLKLVEAENEIRVCAARAASAILDKDGWLDRVRSARGAATTAKGLLLRHESECARCSGVGDVREA